jgi:hypothetical protein
MAKYVYRNMKDGTYYIDNQKFGKLDKAKIIDEYSSMYFTDSIRKRRYYYKILYEEAIRLNRIEKLKKINNDRN